MLLFKLGYMDTVSTLDLLHFIYIFPSQALLIMIKAAAVYTNMHSECIKHLKLLTCVNRLYYSVLLVYWYLLSRFWIVSPLLL